ncbi:MAG: ABC transporter ATP-binding protein [Patescibacteria group bacterium]
MALQKEKLWRAGRVLRIALRGYYGKLALTICLGLLAGFSGSIGVGTAIPLFALLTDQPIKEANVITDTIQGLFRFFHIPFGPAYLLGFIVLLFFCKAGVQFSAKYLSDRTTADFEEKLCNDLYRRTLATRWSFLMGQKVGYLERMLLFDVRQSANIISQINTSALLATSILTYALVAFNISAGITLITLGLGIVLFWTIKPILHRTRKIATSIGQTYRDASHYISEHIIGAKVAKAFGIESALSEQARMYFHKMRNAHTRAALYNYFSGSITEPVGILFIAILFFVTYKQPSFDIAAFAIVVYLIQKMFSFFQSLQGQAQSMSGLIPYFETTLRYRNEIVSNREDEGGKQSFHFAHELSFKDVTFAYRDRESVLRNINIAIPRGAVVAVTGPSGMGKSTFADLTLRLLEPTDGLIALDGIPARDISLAEWRKNIAYVPQEVFLINGTISENIRYFNETLSLQEIETAAKMANIYDTIMALPEKFETQVGERGLQLSGGQRQRIALARALVRKPQMLVLDEPTSALDKESEGLIIEALQKHRGTITIITIGHGTGLTDISDFELTIDHGKVNTEKRI